MKTNLLVASLALSLAPSAFSQNLMASSIRTEPNSPTTCVIGMGTSSYADRDGVSIGLRAYSAENSVALGGYYPQSYGNYSAAIAGYENVVNGDYSAAVAGAGNYADGDYSAAIVGYNNYAGGTCSYALGSSSSAWSNDSLAYGYYAATSSDYSIALGSKNLSSGVYHALSDGWAEDAVLFELGNGAPTLYDYYRYDLSNAITTLKNGQTTLTNKAWLNRDSGTSATADPSSATTDSGGEALVVEGHTRLKGKVVIEQPQGDISMGIYQ